MRSEMPTAVAPATRRRRRRERPDRRALCCTIFALLASLLPRLDGQVPALAASSGAPVAVLGADLSAAGLPEVLRALGATPGTQQLRESVADERSQAHGLLPERLLGVVAVSSVILRPLPPGSGLRVVQNGNVTLFPAQAYANALLTAGVTDADAIIAAPGAQRALGTTALLGLLRAATVSCAAVNPARHSLAIREFALTDALTDAMSYTEAARLLTATKAAAASPARLGAPDLPAIVAQQAAALHVRGARSAAGAAARLPARAGAEPPLRRHRRRRAALRRHPAAASHGAARP